MARSSIVVNSWSALPGPIRAHILRLSMCACGSSETSRSSTPDSSTGNQMGRWDRAGIPIPTRGARDVGCVCLRTSTVFERGDRVMHNDTRMQVSSAAGDLEILQELNHGFIRSVRTSDVAWFDRNLAQDFFNSNADGTLVDRAAFLRQVASPCPVSNFDVREVRIRILGDAA